MTRRNNYLIQAEQAKKRFLTYGQEGIIAKLGAEFDQNYIYVNLLCRPYRVDRTSGCIERQEAGLWVDGNSYEEVMVLLDFLCDSRTDRHLAGHWQSMQTFGQMFHRELLESRDPFAEKIEADPEGFCRACLSLGGQPVPGCDLGYSIELFDKLPVAIQFWHGDEEFFPRTRWLWDANALQYIKYETMYFAVTLAKKRTLGLMGTHHL